MARRPVLNALPVGSLHSFPLEGLYSPAQTARTIQPMETWISKGAVRQTTSVFCVLPMSKPTFQSAAKEAAGLKIKVD